MAGEWTGIKSYRELELLQGASFAQIHIGPDDHSWILPVDLLCHVSTFFKAALKGGFEEAKEKQVTLRDEDPSAFKLFVFWLYNGHLFILRGAGTKTLSVVKAWILGDMLGAPSFQNCTMKTLLAEDESEKLLTRTETIRYIYDNTAVDSPLRKVTVHMILSVYQDIDQRAEGWKLMLSEGGDLIVDLMNAINVNWEAWEDGPAQWESSYLLKG